MRARFHAEPIIQATELLLQERAPRDVAVARPRVGGGARRRPTSGSSWRRSFRQFTSPHDPTPPDAPALQRALHGDADGRGLGLQPLRAGSRSPDGARTSRAITGGPISSCGTSRAVRCGRPGISPPASSRTTYRVTFFEDRAEFYRRDGAITTTLEVLVSPEDDAELRRVSVTNFGVQTREIELTSYAELVLASPAADAAHPAFSKPLRPDGIGAPSSRRCWRPAGSGRPTEPSVWAAHVVVVEGESGGGAQYETDRGRFLGRGRGIRTPMSVIDGRPLSNTTGSVLDPIFSLRRRVRLRPGESARLIFSTLVGPSREAAVALADKYRDPATFERTVTLAWTQAQVQLHHLGIDAERGAPVPGSRGPDPLRGPDASAVRRRAAAQHDRAPPRSGPTGSPATSRSSWSASTSPRIGASSASSSARTSTGA